MSRVPRNTILIGDARDRLLQLPRASIDCVVTSPPYYRLRDFGAGEQQIGLEQTVDAWVDSLREVFRGIANVLKPAGALWLNLGDSYSRSPGEGAPTKGLVLAPERLLLGLAADGWIVRNKVIWAKTNPMPSGILDRLEATYDVVYFLVRSLRYFFDLDAIRASTTRDGVNTLAKGPGDVWPLATAGFRGPHFATFPTTLVERPILSTCPSRLCVACGAPWKTTTTVRRVGNVVRSKCDHVVRRYPARYQVIRTHPRLVPGCRCNARTRPGIVLDPFFGTGTVGIVASGLRRDWLGIEVNPTYAGLASQRLLEAAA